MISAFSLSPSLLARSYFGSRAAIPITKHASNLRYDLRICCTYMPYTSKTRKTLIRFIIEMRALVIHVQFAFNELQLALLRVTILSRVRTRLASVITRLRECTATGSPRRCHTIGQRKFFAFLFFQNLNPTSSRFIKRLIFPFR